MTGIQYVKAFCAEARQLGSIQNGARFLRMEVPLADAIEWANRGFTPSEAMILIDLGFKTAADALANMENGEIFAHLVEAL
jgi:hypothetical protein